MSGSMHLFLFSDRFSLARSPHPFVCHSHTHTPADTIVIHSHTHTQFQLALASCHRPRCLFIYLIVTSGTALSGMKRMRIDKCARHFHSIDASQIDRLYVIKCQKIVPLNAPLNEFILFENIWPDISVHLRRDAFFLAYTLMGAKGHPLTIDHRVRIQTTHRTKKYFKYRTNNTFNIGSLETPGTLRRHSTSSI